MVDGSFPQSNIFYLAAGNVPGHFSCVFLSALLFSFIINIVRINCVRKEDAPVSDNAELFFNGLKRKLGLENT